MDHTVTVNCWRVERIGKVYIGPFQLGEAEANRRHGQIFGTYYWERAHPDA